MTDEKNKDNNGNSFIWAFIEIIVRWRRLLIINSFLATVLTLAVLLLFPNRYMATTSIMPPEKDMGGMGMAAAMLPSGISSLLGGSGLSLPGMATPSDLYAAILRSNAVSMAVLEKNNLKEIYEAKLDIDALLKLHDNTSIIVTPEGMIVLSYEDTDPLRAADVANCFIEELNRINRENLVSKARAMREFIEERLEESVRDLTLAEEEFKAFQLGHNAIALDEQIKASINAIADLRGQLILSEIELGVMKKSLSPNNARFKNQEFKIEQIKMQLLKLEKGDSAMQDSSILNVSMTDAPELGLQYARLLRELKIQETIFQLLKQQYEQAKIQELRDTPTVQVLDAARPPEKKSGPFRVSSSVLGGILSFGLTLFFVIIYEFTLREKKKNSDLYHKIQGFTNVLNEDLYWIRSIFSRKRGSDAG
ncbi:MAG: hypothetical protein V3W18_01225 [candidate division Zixibacteria bacterium]